MNKIIRNDTNLEIWTEENPFQVSKAPGIVKGFLDNYLHKLGEMIESIDLMDGEMLESARVKAGTLQTEILHLKHARTVASGYRKPSVNSPRFLDKRR
jgi:hypothetical protein